MTVGEAIQRQKEFVANKYNKNRYPNNELKESMKVLTKAYDELWEFLEREHQEILDEFLMKGEEEWKKYKLENILELNVGKFIK